VYAQKYSNWELILVDASSIDKISSQIELLSQNDTRVRYLKIINQGIAANTNVGIEAASGDYVCFLDHDDTLDPGALAENALVINKHPKADLIYSDEDKIDDSGEYYSNPHYKPGFSIDLLRSVNYITHFVVTRIDLVKEVGGIRLGFDGAQDYDFLLRIVDKTRHIYHIPKVLYHWRQAEGSTSRDFNLKKNVTDAGVRALDDHFKRNSIKATAYALKGRPGFYGSIYDLSSANRAIYIVTPDNELQKIKDYIKKSYIKLATTGKIKVDIHTITSIDEVDTKRYEYVLLVQGRITPTEKDGSLNSMFGIVENGSRYSSVKLVSNNRIYDSGYIKQKYGFMPLFLGLDPALPMHFGSSEWNRNVDGLSTLLVCLAAKDITNIKKNDLIIAENEIMTLFGQFQYHIFSPLEPASQDPSENTGFNSNLAHGTDPRVLIMDDITPYIKVKK
jgi:glycosyltransferase involved in cell wall biosynthesis